MNENQQLEVLPPTVNVPAMRDSATDMMRRATDVAGVCKEIVLKTACNIQGKKYIKCEGWMSIATAHGCIAGSRDVKKVEGGYTAIGEIRRISDGAILSTAEGFVGTAEKRWGKADEYACRAMAQTRAISRACRAAFAHVVVLMDAGLSTTPFEEVPEGGFNDAGSPPARQTPPPATPTPQARKNVPTVKQELSSDVLTELVCLESFKMVNSKPGAARPWTAWFCNFEREDGTFFEAGTFNEEIAAKLDVFKGVICNLAHRAGKKAGTREIVAVDPQ